MESAALDVKDLSYTHARNNKYSYSALKEVCINVPRGSRCLLLGANGAGKSTLLQILAGKRMTRSETKVLGQDVFFNTPKGVTYLGTEWASNPVVRSDIVVSHFLDSVGGYRYKERRDELLDLLDVDLDWHMHEISDGERRRVQIVQGLMQPWDMLLLDEVTVDLDVLVRSDLLRYLINETKQRNATILYATHIFDGLDEFPTHVCHLQLGKTLVPSTIDWLKILQNKDIEKSGLSSEILQAIMSPDRQGSKLLTLGLSWLKQDRDDRRELEKSGLYNTRGAKDSDVPADSETFYRKYDYRS